jgi:hypothetical protein
MTATATSQDQEPEIPNLPEPPERLPVYSIPKILQLRDRLCEFLVPRYAELVLGDRTDLELLATDITELMPPRVPYITILESVRPSLGSAYTAEGLREFSWRLAASVERLRSGQPLAPWRAPGVREWAPLHILRVEATKSNQGDSRYQLRLRALAGTACPLVFEKRFSGKWLGRLSRFVGFTRGRGVRPFHSPYQYTSLRLFALLDPKLSKFDTPNFFEVRCPGSLLQHNIDVLSWRMRTRGFNCPHEFTHECHQCAIGYLSCKAATHREDYIQGVCMTCGHSSWFDPEASTTECIPCWRKRVTTSI